MKCLTQELMVDYMEDKLSPEHRRKLEQHFEHCKHCQRQLEQWVDELEEAGKALVEEPLSEDLDRRIISALPAHPVKMLHRAADTRQLPIWKKRSLDIMKKTTIAAATLAVVISGGMMYSPTFSTYVNGVFASSPTNKAEPVGVAGNGLLTRLGDDGIEEAAKKGFLQTPNASVADQGFTLTVHEVVADPFRICILTSIKDKSNKKESHWDAYQKGQITIKDKQGNVLHSSTEKGALKWGLTGKGTGKGVNEDGPYMELVHDLSSLNGGKGLPDELIVAFDIKKIGETNGNWQMEVPVDLKKAKAATKTYAVNKSYTTPQGLKLDVKQITFAPTGVELVVDRNTKEMEYSFELVDEHGSVLGAWAPGFIYGKDGERKNLMSDPRRSKWRPSEEIGESVRDFHYFQPIDETKNMILRLGPVYKQEPAAFQAKLDLAKLEKAPVTVEEQGNRYTFQHEKNQADEPDHYIVRVEATIGNGTAPMNPLSTFGVITDESGKKYDSAFLNDERKYENGQLHINGGLLLKGVKKLPKELIISYDKKYTEHHDAKWEVPIQTGK
ncbi:DUF4179 domain-containing protein [Brevibacillus borstelensis]|uniref:DUF4179 domain-containing protein n=1 Tax=Brevibacillus borstelensis TaxID=45462 RepID=UPI0004F282BF|nr:DUF4179 domain-containing protein [Brevibacillus borstelensis]KKX57069.1 hypothetical protein X546_00635 [Brevibacillus borstelensis cifa_chp40]